MLPTTESDGIMAQQQARSEQLYPGGILIAGPKYPAPGFPTDPTQRDILNLDILRAAQVAGETPTQTVARATAYKKWIHENG